MLTAFVIRLVLMILVLLVVVPAATNYGVAVRQGGFFRGFLTLLIVSLLNSVLWIGLSVTTLGAALLANVLLFGLVGLLVNGASFYIAAGIMPDVLQVRNFGSACWAALIMTVASGLINTLVLAH